jgi:hypothetical protein
MSKYTDTRKQMVFKTAGGGSSSLAISTTPISGSTPGEILIVGPSNELEESPIKTINGNSLLGSGDLVVGGGGGVHAQMILPTGGYYTSVITAASPTSTTGVANYMHLYPFIPMNTVSTSSFMVLCNNNTAGALGRVLIYSNSNALPLNKLYESANIDLSTSGTKTITSAQTFTAGSVYWLAWQVNSASPQMICYTAGGMISLAGNRTTTNYNINYLLYASNIGSAPATLTQASLSNATGAVTAINLISQ